MGLMGFGLGLVVGSCCLMGLWFCEGRVGEVMSDDFTFCVIIN